MFSRDDMQRAIEDALKTMEGVALELYRRGREPLLEELEEARARNADIRAMLEQVTRERDEARASLATLEHMLGEERENVDTLRAAVEHAEQRFVDQYDARKAAEREIAELKARITTLEAMR